MGARTSYIPGTFCWVDLATNDVEGATAFYHRLLGWVPQDIPATVGVSYRTMRRDGHLVAAVSQMPESQRASGAPPAWLAYVAVEDAALTAQRTEGLGGTVARRWPSGRPGGTRGRVSSMTPAPSCSTS